MAATNTITAASFGVGAFTNENFSAQNKGTVELGQVNTINASSITVGFNKNVGLLEFLPGLTNPKLVIRNTAGNGRAGLVVATDSSGQQPTVGTIDLVTSVTGNSILDAMISSGTIGTTTGGAQSSTGTFLMGGGTLDATSLFVGQSQSAANNVGTFSTFGGLLKIGMFVLGDQHSTGIPTANFTLDGGGALSATAVQLGTVSGGSVSAPTVNFNWNSGTISNYNTSGSTTGLTVTIPSITLASTGTHMLFIDAGQTGTINAALNGGGGATDLTKSGAGMAILTVSNGYSGATSVAGGTLKMTGAADINASSAINISNASFIHDSSTASLVPVINLTSGTLGGTGAFSNATATVASSPSNVIIAGDSGAGTLSVNSLTFNGSAQVYVSFGASLLNTTTLNVNGGAGSVVILNAGGFPTAVGEYPLVAYTGSIGGTGSAAFVLGGAQPPRTVAHLDFSNAGVIDYDVTGTDHPVWTGSQSSTWSTATIPNPKNWKLAVGGGATDFITGDNVSFDDTAHTGNVQISAANVQPVNVVFNNNVLAYTVTGPFGIADYSSSQSTALDLNGTGLVVLATTNSYTGGTNINGGTLQLGNGAANGSVAGNLNDNGVLAFTPATTATLPGVISGTGAVEMGGSGRMILTGASVYSGGTTINGGTLQLGDGVTTGSFTGSVTSNGVLAFNEGAPFTFPGVITGGGALTQNSTSTLTLTASNGYTGTTYVNAGVLSIGNGGAGEFLTSPTIINNAALVFNHSDALTYSGNISGSGSVTKSGAGTLVMAGSNNYTGLTAIGGGVLNLPGATAITGGGGISFQGGTLQYSGTDAAVLAGPVVNSGASTININVTSGTLQMSGNLDSSNSGGLLVYGAGLLVLSSSNNYSGTTTVGTGQGPGTVLAIASGAFGTGTLTFDGQGNASTAQVLLANNITLSNPISQIGRNGNPHPPSFENLSGNNTLSGGITLQVGGTYYLQSDSGLLTISGGTSITSNAGGARNVNLQGNGNGLISGAIINGNATSGLSLTTLGTGVWTISSTGNTYTGGSNVNSGVLQFAKTAAMPSSGTVAVASGAILAVNVGGPGEFTTATNGNGSIGGLVAGVGGQGSPVNWTTGAILGIDTSNAPGASVTYSGNIGGTTGLAVLGTGTLVLTGNNTYPGGTDVLGGTLIVASPSAIGDGTNLSVGSAASLTVFGTILSPPVPSEAVPAAVSPVPEPSAWLLLAAAFSGLLLWRRRN
jgi:autotransporter-associated beta strand protein